jgi:hypothetical protein
MLQLAPESKVSSTAMRSPAPSALTLALLVAGCAADSAVVGTLTTTPGYFDTLSCKELAGRYKSDLKRETDLASLMDKSGNAVVNTIAYSTDYAKARSARQAAEEANARKGCDPLTPPEPPAPAKPAAKKRQAQTPR